MNLFGRKNPSPDSPEAQAMYWESLAKTLEMSNMKLREQYEQVQRLAESYRNESRKHMGELQRVAQTICDNDYAREQLGGKNRILSLSSFELANFIIENWKKQRQEAIQLVADLQKALKREQAEKRDLEAQLERLLQQHREMAWSNQETSPPAGSVVQVEGRQVDTETGEILENAQPVPDILEVAKSSSESSFESPDEPSAYDTPKTHLILLEDAESKLTDIQWRIMEAIGKEGMSESKEIEAYVLSGDSNRTQFVNGLSGLKQMGIVAEDKINTGWRWFYAYHLSDLGLQLYQKRFRRPAVLCEKHVLKKEHASIEHGYIIKDTATLLEQFGYVNISYDRQANAIELSNKKVWIPDITAFDNLSRKRLFVEVECGNHTQEEFNEKMDKARQVTNDLRFVCPDKNAMETIVQQFSRWKLEKTKVGAPVKNFEVWITTTKKLAEKDWGQNYPS
jgi:Chromosome segregation ATPases